MTLSTARLRLLLATRGRLVAALLAVAAVALLFLAGWTAAVPAETVSETVDTREITTDLEHAAAVQSDEGPWEPGTRLENHPVYLTGASPELELQARTEAPPGTEIAHEVHVEQRVERNGEVVWRESTGVLETEHTVDAGPVTSNGTVDVPALRDRQSELRDEFAGAGQIQVLIVVTTRYETASETGATTVNPRLSLADRFYWIDGETSVREAHEETQTVQRDAPLPLGWIVASLVGSGLAGAASIAVWRHEPTDDADALRQQVHHERFREWISRGTIPDCRGRERVWIESLPDLVDVAIDSDARVIYDRARDAYAVLGEDALFYYSRHGAGPQVEPGPHRDDRERGDDHRRPESEPSTADTTADSATDSVGGPLEPGDTASEPADSVPTSTDGGDPGAEGGDLDADDGDPDANDGDLDAEDGALDADDGDPDADGETP